ncbi:MAG TPA: DUF4097 family beta strand repeat-containing protein [Actinomycetota bacterium]
MPTFVTADPISLTLELGLGNIRIIASDRAETTVDVRPNDPSKKADVAAAEQTRVEYANGKLLVKAPKGWRQWTPWGGHESVDVRVELPTGSHVRGSAGVADWQVTGRIGGCQLHTGVGDIQIEEATSVELTAGVGAVDIDAVGGSVEITTAGAVRIGRVAGPTVIKNRNGDTWIGEVVGEARVNAANGAISIDVAHAGITAKTANGAVRLGEVARGSVVAQSAFGAVEVGVRDGIAAWLDLQTKLGAVQSDLDPVERPEAGEDAVEIQAHTSMGDITIQRSFASDTAKDLP